MVANRTRNISDDVGVDRAVIDSNVSGGQSIYLNFAGEQAFAVYHRASPAAMRDCAVVLCPPFGWEELSSYRSLRVWAARLAAAGHPTLRLTFPSTGDSAGSARDPGRLDAWTEAVVAAARWVRSSSGASSVIGVGISFGGLIACRATAVGALLDGLVLWSTPARARDLIRQLRAFSRLEQAQSFNGLQLPPPLPTGDLEAGGFLLSSETISALSALDLTTLQFPAGLRLGVLMLARDGIRPSDELRAALERQGVGVWSDRGNGYADMTSHPQESRLPEGVVARVTAWLDQNSQKSDIESAAAEWPIDAQSSVQIEISGTPIVERPVEIQQDFGRLAGVLTEPSGGSQSVCAVFLNAGAIRRVGPNRMWVELARRWAARGIPSFRFDVEGIGEADGASAPYQQSASLYEPELVSQVIAAVDALHARGVAERFVLVGMCAGAYWSFHAALDHPRVTATLMLNVSVLIWDERLAPSRDLRRASFRFLVKLHHNDVRARITAIVRWLAAAIKQQITSWLSRAIRPPSIAAQVDAALERLRVSRKRALMLFAAHEQLDEDLIRSGRMADIETWPNVTVERIAVSSHTLRPNWAQQQAYAILDRALERELRAASERHR
jgi:pimeloyl-ACP methyl ester carboxylesterase